MQADLAKTLAIEPPQAVLMVNKLEARGLAMRIRSNPRQALVWFVSQQNRGATA